MTSQTQNVPSSPFSSLPIDLEQLQHFREHRAREIFHSLLQDPIRVAGAVQAVAALTPNKRKLLVMDHVIWRHVTASNRTYRRLFVNESSRRCDGQEALLNPHILANRTRNRGECVLLVRAQAKLNNALEHCMGHIGCDTVEISDLRMRQTAVRALLYFEAQKIQEDEEIRRVTGSHPSNSHPMRRTSSSLVITPMLPPIAPSLPATNPFEGKVNGSSGCYEPSAIVPAQSSMDSSYIPLQASRAGPSQGQGSRSASSPSSSPLLPPLQQKVKNASSRRALLGNKPHSTIHTHRSVPSATLAKMAACARPKGMESSSAKEGTLEQPNLSSQCLRVKSKHDVNVSSILWSLESYELRDVVLRLRRLV